jgi:hypothetical protein
MPATRSGRRQFAVAVFVGQRADDLLGVLLALDSDEASAIQQAFEFARDTWGRDPASLHYVAAKHGALERTRRSGR